MADQPPFRPVRLGVAGLGRAFVLMQPTFEQDPRVVLAGAAARAEGARRQFEAQYGGRAYGDIAELAADPDIDAIYIATPHQLHREHVLATAQGGKHVIVEKPMALTVEDCQAMVDAAAANGVSLIVGHSHSFDGPYLLAHRMIRSGDYGRPRMITAVNYTDFLYRPRRPEEFLTDQGGGVVYSQAAHQIDVVRLLADSPAVSIQAVASSWDLSRGTEGAYTAIMKFASGAFATLTYSGYGRFDTDEFNDWIGELGQRRDPSVYGQARARLKTVASPEQEAALKSTRTFGAGAAPPADVVASNHFGLVVVSCERADLRPQPKGVMVYSDEERRLEPLPPLTIPRVEVVDEIYDVVVGGQRPLHSGEWGLATVEACKALLTSAAEGREIKLKYGDAGHG